LCADELGLFPTAGIHPHDAKDAGPAERAAIEELCRRPECVGVGETGLDFFKGFSPRAAQLESFLWHLDLARRLAKPIVIHCRDAHADTVRCLQQFPGVRGVMHCYTMGPEELAPYLDAGLYISFSGVVTYPKNEANREAARAVPLQRLLVETDCPYLAPQGRRGKRNEPANVLVVLEELARVRETELEGLAQATSTNAAELFGLPEVGQLG
jgi:TatD DNase family protein